MRTLWREFAVILLAVAIWASFAICTYGCTAQQAAQFAKATDTVFDIAHKLCMVTGQQRTGLSPGKLVKTFCTHERVVREWEPLIKEAQTTGAMATGMVKPQ